MNIAGWWIGPRPSASGILTNRRRRLLVAMCVGADHKILRIVCFRGFRGRVLDRRPFELAHPLRNMGSMQRCR